MSAVPPTGAAGALEAPALGLAPRTRQLLSDYAELTKPKVQSLLLLTTIATMYVAGDPSPLLVALTCLGGYLSAGGAGAVKRRSEGPAANGLGKSGRDLRHECGQPSGASRI